VISTTQRLVAVEPQDDSTLLKLAFAHTVRTALLGKDLLELDIELSDQLLAKSYSRAQVQKARALLVTQVDAVDDRLNPCVEAFHSAILVLIKAESTSCNGVVRGPPMTVQEQCALLQPFRQNSDPSVEEVLPWIRRMRNAGYIDATISGEVGVDRSEAYALEAKCASWCLRRPWIGRFLDPPHTLVLPVLQRAVAGLAGVVASIPAGRFAAVQPADPADARAVPGLHELVALAGNEIWTTLGWF
jgi:hypothetical protein